MIRRPVLVLTGKRDPTADLVIAELNHRNVPVIRLDPGRDFPEEVMFAAHLNTDGGRWAGPLRTTSRRIDLAAVRSLYWRRPSAYASQLDGQDGQFAKAQARFGFGGVLQALDALHVNHPRRVHAAEYKPAQLAVAAQLGLQVPETLITNEVDQARSFVKRFGPAVYKVLRQTPFQREGEAATVWVDIVDVGDLDESVSGTAHLFQQFVPKVADIRITIVGDHVFCVRIDAPDEMLDWRRDYARLAYSVATPPPALVTSLRGYLRTFGLVFGCFDFVLDGQGDWHFIECNPNGQWAWMEEPTGLPMTVAFADLLENNG